MNTKDKIDSGLIQTELNRLNESKPDGSKVKSPLFNLIFYTHEPCRTEYYKKIAATIMEQFPCRIIFIKGDIHAQQPLLNVKVTPASGKSCDQILIEAGKDELSRVPFLILPHLIPDLPIYLFWGQDPSKDTTILPILQPMATRIIFDSESTDNLQQFGQTLLKLFESLSTEIVDMNWVRTAGWRQIIAKAFDSKERFNLLCQTGKIRLVYNDVSDPSFTRPQTQAIYLQAWLASCLGWKFEKLEHQDKNHILTYQDHAGQISVQLEPMTRKDLAPEDIIEFEIGAPNNYECIFTRKTANQVAVKASNQYQCLLPFMLILPTLQSGRSFMQEIFYLKISDQYPGVLKLISQIDWR